MRKRLRLASEHMDHEFEVYKLPAGWSIDQFICCCCVFLFVCLSSQCSPRLPDCVTFLLVLKLVEFEHSFNYESSFLNSRSEHWQKLPGWGTPQTLWRSAWTQNATMCSGVCQLFCVFVTCCICVCVWDKRFVWTRWLCNSQRQQLYKRPSLPDPPRHRWPVF